MGNVVNIPNVNFNELIQIEQNHAYCTLLTCTPYGINSHRLLVRGHRIDNLEETFKTGDFSYLTKEFLDGLDLRSGEIIESSAEKGKVIVDFNCY